MRDIGWFVVAVLLAWFAFNCGHKAGKNDGWKQADNHYARIIAQDVEKGIAGFRRVQAIRERSEYSRGKESCHE